MVATSAGFVRSNGRIKGSDPTSPANAFNLSAERATSASLAPFAINRLATAAPIPELAPVTIIVLFFRLPSILGLPIAARLSTQQNTRVADRAKPTASARLTAPFAHGQSEPMPPVLI